MNQTVIVPLDGSPLAESVLPWAVALARAGGWRLCLVQAAHVPATAVHGMLEAGYVPMIYEDAVAAEQAEDTAYLRDVCRRHLADVPDVMIAVRFGDAEHVVLDLADELGAAAIALASHGRSGIMRLLLGSIAEQIIHHATVPVLVVRADAHHAVPTPSFERIIVPVDGSRSSERALDIAASIVAQHGTIVLTRAVEAMQMMVPLAEGVAHIDDEEATAAAVADAGEYLVGVAERRGISGVNIEGATVIDHPAEGILKAAHEQRANLIVMSTHGDSHPSHRFLGSIADRVVRHTDLPLLLVSARALATSIAVHGTVADIMTRQVVTVGVDETLLVAVRKLLRRRVSGAPVVDAEGRLVGALSEADLLDWQAHLVDTLVAEDALEPSEFARRLDGTTVRTIMHSPVVSIHDTASLTEALRLLQDRSIRGLPVEADGKLVGVVTRADLLGAMFHHWEETATATE